MSSLFEPFQTGQLNMANRIAMAPLTRNRSPNAIPGPFVATYYTQRASAGLLITEATAITQQGQGYADVPGLYAPEQLRAWRKVTDEVHAAGGCIVTQLWHVGRISHTSLQPNGAAPVAPSAIAAKSKSMLIENGVPRQVETSMPRALDISELPGIVADYVRAASAAVNEGGFDGIEIHGANGYLLDQFLKSGSNHRTDAYGGPIENRARFMLEVAQAIVEAIGGGRVGIRLSPLTPANDSYDSEAQVLYEYVLTHLATLGLAYIHVIEGSTGGAREIAERPFDYRSAQAAYRRAGGQGAWMVNNGYDLEMAAKALAAGADMVAFGKPFIGNPDLVERLRTGAPLVESNRKTWYGGGAEGYTDYPALPKNSG